MSTYLKLNVTPNQTPIPSQTRLASPAKIGQAYKYPPTLAYRNGCFSSRKENIVQTGDFLLPRKPPFIHKSKKLICRIFEAKKEWGIAGLWGS